MRRTNQFERTDRDITNALLAVMDRKPFEKITVQDILDEAMINRSTFYQHFPDKYAILERVQDRYVEGLTARVQQVIESNTLDLGKINEIFADYLSRHRVKMAKLLSVRSENLNLEGRMRDLFRHYFVSSGAALNDVELEMLSGMMVSFFSSALRKGEEIDNLSERLMAAWMHMTLFFYRVEEAPNAGARLMDLIGEMHRESPRQTV